MATAVTSMRIPTELNERYSRLAKETGRSRSFYVNEALQEAIDRFEYEYGILKDIEDYRAGRLEKEAKAEGKSTGAYARGILADGLMAIA